MAKWTKEKRDALPEGRFGDPKNRLFPIEDQEDVRDAARLIGKAGNPDAVKARVRRIAGELGLSLPEAWKDKDTSKHSEGAGDSHVSIAAFALEKGGRYVDGEYAVYPSASIFRSGDYESRAFSLTREEQWAAAESFAPVWGNIEHTDFLKGKACHVRSLALDEGDPDLLRGEVAIPLWLDEHLGDHERKLSAEWDREDKSFAGLALCVHPHIPEAALFTAFSEHVKAHPELQPELLAQMSTLLETVGGKVAEFGSKYNTPEGQGAMQHIHNHAAMHGAVCDKANAKFVSAHERSGMQDIHDHAVKHGAMCSGIPAGVRSGPGNSYFFTDDSPNPKGSAVSTETKTDATEPNAQVAPTVHFADMPEYRAMQERAAKLEAEVARFATSEAERRAEIDALKALAEGERRSKQAHQVAAFVREREFPRALEPRICEVLAHARELDHKAADRTANFTASDSTSKVEFSKALEELLVDLKKAAFTQLVAGNAQLPPGHQVLPNEADSTTAVFAEAQALLKHTPSGKAYLAKHGGKFEPVVD